jgi:hypothetical protein
MILPCRTLWTFFKLFRMKTKNLMLRNASWCDRICGICNKIGRYMNSLDRTWWIQSISYHKPFISGFLFYSIPSRGRGTKCIYFVLLTPPPPPPPPSSTKWNQQWKVQKIRLWYIKTCLSMRIFLFLYSFGVLECADSSFAYVPHLWILRDVWIRTESAAVASGPDIATHPPS